MRNRDRFYTSPSEINACIEWAISIGWELDPIPPQAEFQVMRLRRAQSSGPPVFAIAYRSDRGRYTCDNEAAALMLQFRRKKSHAPSPNP